MQSTTGGTSSHGYTQPGAGDGCLDRHHRGYRNQTQDNLIQTLNAEGVEETQRKS